MTSIPAPFQEQEMTANFLVEKKTIADFSDPGTGKTRSQILGFTRSPDAKRMLVIAPLSILQPSWGADIDTFASELKYRIAHGTPQKRKDAFLDYNADVVIMNHDGVSWLLENHELLQGFSHLAVDESTAFKNPTNKRTKAIMKLLYYFEYRCPMSGTPHPKNILDIWSQIFIADYGERLGNSFYKFRNQLCKEVTETIYVKGEPRDVKIWVPQHEAEDYISLLISDIVIRHKLTDMPKHDVLTYRIDMPRWLQNAYDDFIEHSVYYPEDGTAIIADHAIVVRTKVRQLLSGALYDGDRLIKVHRERSDLVLDLATQAEHSIIGFNFTHERDRLIELARARNIGYAYIDGTIRSPAARAEIVKDFQEGKYDTIFLHPQAAGHGLTLTRATRTVWHSPAENLEYYIQLNRRAYRRGQTNETQTIRVAYNNSIEEDIYDLILTTKDDKQNRSLDIFDLITKARQE